MALSGLFSNFREFKFLACHTFHAVVESRMNTEIADSTERTWNSPGQHKTKRNNNKKTGTTHKMQCIARQLAVSNQLSTTQGTNPLCGQGKTAGKG
jgi:hypothetical protein